MKTKEELNAMKAEAETLGAKLAELTEDELAEVSGGVNGDGNDGMCLLSLCPYANKLECPMYQSLPQYCVK